MTERRGPDECWEWKGGVSKSGYGNFFPSHRLQMSAHRFSGTQAENIKDRDGKGHGMVGVKNHKAKLSSQKIALGRLYRLNGWTYRKIASHFNVNTKTMHNALRGTTWKAEMVA